MRNLLFLLVVAVAVSPRALWAIAVDLDDIWCRQNIDSAVCKFTTKAALTQSRQKREMQSIFALCLHPDATTALSNAGYERVGQITQLKPTEVLELLDNRFPLLVYLNMRLRDWGLRLAQPEEPALPSGVIFTLPSPVRRRQPLRELRLSQEAHDALVERGVSTVGELLERFGSELANEELFMQGEVSDEIRSAIRRFSG